MVYMVCNRNYMIDRSMTSKSWNNIQIFHVRPWFVKVFWKKKFPYLPTYPIFFRDETLNTHIFVWPKRNFKHKMSNISVSPDTTAWMKLESGMIFTILIYSSGNDWCLTATLSVCPISWHEPILQINFHFYQTLRNKAYLFIR
jgi:hypothetical protein